MGNRPFGIGAKLGLAGAALALLAGTAAGIGIYGQFAQVLEDLLDLLGHYCQSIDFPPNRASAHA